ncbi:MAG TPA: ubiquinone/menaquinone biosynthesis methyltransferase [Candidatus Thermoplasmatota archaeon]|nr:ubiquinone/menaquinone biosynthesis methyltransferase [Candidatus Thermoplasmatota archaeon]
MAASPERPATLKGDEKEQYVEGMFNRIAPRYDLLNRVMSMKMDQRWRRRAARELDLREGDVVVDLGAGTGDLSLEVARAHRGARVVALDLARAMLTFIPAKRGNLPVEPTHGSALALPVKSGSAGGAVTAFVLRNVKDLDLFFREAHRVLRPGGRFVSLEISRPPGKVMGPLYRFYFFRVMPKVGAWLSKDRQAYTYLSETVQMVETPAQIAGRLQRAGFEDVRHVPLMRGAVMMHVARKP